MRSSEESIRILLGLDGVFCIVLGEMLRDRPAPVSSDSYFQKLTAIILGSHFGE